MVEVETMIPDPVRRGAEFLDDHVPGWADRIDLEKLDMTDCVACIAGQLLGHYKELNGEWGFGLYEARRFGFTVEPEEGDKGLRLYGSAFAELKNGWRAEIERRTA